MGDQTITWSLSLQENTEKRGVIYVLNGIRTHDTNVCATYVRLDLKQHGYWGRQLTELLPNADLQSSLLQLVVPWRLFVYLLHYCISLISNLFI